MKKILLFLLLSILLYAALFFLYTLAYMNYMVYLCTRNRNGWISEPWENNKKQS